jgi:ankyrin repeat protein
MVVPSLYQRNMMLQETSSSTMMDTSIMSCDTRTTDALDDSHMRHEQRLYPLHQMLADLSLRSLGDHVVARLGEQQITDLIRARPSLLHEFNPDGLTAFHVACMEGVSLTVIEALVENHRGSVAMATRNRKEMLPLHLVCRYYSGSSANMCCIVQYLLAIYPDAASVAAGTGEVALHLCLQNPFCTLPLIKLLIRAFPGAIRLVTNKKRQLPLHLACERHYFHRLASTKCHRDTGFEVSNTSDDIIRYLVELDEEALSIFDAKGFLPIHAAVRGYQTPTTLKFLLSAFPDSIQFVDAKGRTPLHLCVSNAVPDLATTAILMAADPSATAVTDDKNNLPLQYATASGQLDLIFALVQASPSCLDVLRSKR